MVPNIPGLQTMNKKDKKKKRCVLRLKIEQVGGQMKHSNIKTKTEKQKNAIFSKMQFIFVAIFFHYKCGFRGGTTNCVHVNRGILTVGLI